jgi:hypothetical protein
MSFSDKVVATIVLMIVLCLFFVGFTCQARMEANTFNKLTGRTDVTWWDALWVELRVDGK